MSQQGALSSSSGGGGSSVSLSPYIVGATNADYTTIQAAINAAHTAGASNTNMYNIYIKPGTYTENLTLYDGINLVGFTDNGDTIGFNADSYSQAIPSVTLLGSVSFTQTVVGYSDKIQIKGIWINPPTGDAVVIDMSTTGTVFLFFSNCQIITNEEDKACFNITGTCYLYFKDSTIANLNSTTARFARFASAGFSQSSYIQAAGSNIYANFDTNHLVIPANYSLFVDIDSTYWYPCIDASASGAMIRITADSSQILTPNGSNDYFINSGSNTFIASLSGCSFGSSTTPFIASGPSNFLIANTTSFGYIVNSSSAFNFNGNINLANCSYIAPTTQTVEIINKCTLGAWRGSQNISTQSGLHTTDATLTAIASVLVNELDTIVLKGTIVGSTTDHVQSVGGSYEIVARRATGGNVTLVGAVVKNVQSTSAATFDCDVDTATQTIRITVTGVAATIYNWVATYSYHKVLIDE